MALTDVAVRTAKPSEKARKLADEKGMYLLIQSSGAKLWRMDYRFDAKRKTLALGTYPETSLAKAREKRDEGRKLLAQEIDPSAQRKQDKAERRDAQANTFEAIARDWMKVRGKEWSETYPVKVCSGSTTRHKSASCIASLKQRSGQPGNGRSAIFAAGHRASLAGHT